MTFYVYSKGILAEVKQNRKGITVTSRECKIKDLPSGYVIYVEDFKSFDCKNWHLFDPNGPVEPTVIGNQEIDRGDYIFYSAEKAVSPHLDKFFDTHNIQGNNRAEKIAYGIIEQSCNRLVGAKEPPRTYVSEKVRKPLRKFGYNGLVKSQQQFEKDKALHDAIWQANRGCGVLSNISEQGKIHKGVYYGDIKSDYVYHMLSREYPVGMGVRHNFICYEKGYRYLFRVHTDLSISNNDIIIPLYASYLLDKDCCKPWDMFCDDNDKAICIRNLDTWMTDVDYESFKKYYDNTNLQILDCYRWVAEMLPQEFRDFEYNAFVLKETVEDPTAKLTLNSTYGVMDSKYINSKYDNWSYLIGTWTCSFARETQYKLIEKTGAYYSAIDSFYHDSEYNYDEYNNEVIEEMTKLGYAPVNGKMLGMVETKNYDKMRVQGINRYVLNDDKLVCSGCVVNKFPIEKFTKNAVIPNGLKLVHRNCYTHEVKDECRDYRLNTVAYEYSIVKDED